MTEFEEVENLKKKVQQLEADLKKKADIVGQLKKLLQDSEDLTASYKQDNVKLRQQLKENEEKQQLQQQQVVQKGKHDDEEDEDEASSLPHKIQQFLQHMASHGNSITKVHRTELYLATINILSTLFHIDYNEELFDEEFPLVQRASELEEDDQSRRRFHATKIAFHYTLEFFRQLHSKKLQGVINDIGDEDDKETLTGPNRAESFPLLWLLGMFPFHSQHAEKDSEWLPLHMFLALDVTYLALDEYIGHLHILMREFGDEAFAEDVSPLSIAVAKPFPSLTVIQAVINHRPDSVLHEDDDGCVAIMHACACNESTDVIEFLYEQQPNSIKQEDNFGCSAIHYATFSGFPDTVRFLIDNNPTCVQVTEGNGALPLHDAVQNPRGYDVQYELTELLLEQYQHGAMVRDNYGAFPLHKAAKSSNCAVVELLHSAFPKGVFAEDKENLLPMHYYSERVDKDQHLDVVQFILKHNPSSKVLHDAQLFQQSSAPAKTSLVSSFFSRVTSTSPIPMMSNTSNNKAAVGANNADAGKRRRSATRRTSVHAQYRR